MCRALSEATSARQQSENNRVTQSVWHICPETKLLISTARLHDCRASSHPTGSILRYINNTDLFYICEKKFNMFRANIIVQLLIVFTVGEIWVSADLQSCFKSSLFICIEEWLVKQPKVSFVFPFEHFFFLNDHMKQTAPSGREVPTPCLRSNS